MLIRLPDGNLVPAAAGQRLIDAVIGNEPSFPAFCAGRGVCGKCRVKVQGELSTPSDIERRRLAAWELDSGIRLACQTKVLGDVSIDAYPGFALPLLSVSGVTGAKGGGRCPAEVMSVLPPGSAEAYGLAVDIGTTTLAAYLVDLRCGRVLGAESCLNPQCAHGADVVSRIAYAGTPEGLARLNGEVVKALNRLALMLAARHGVEPSRIYAVTAVGNTCMQHLFLGVSPAGLAFFPFHSAIGRNGPVNAVQLGLDINGNAVVEFLPGVGGFVGSDILAVALSCGIRKNSPPTLAVDVGTNGEVLLAGNGRLLACSTAAGPAFEGVNISCGTIASEGAVDAAWVAESPEGPALEYHVIGSGPPRGICGSGLISIVTALRRLSILDASGRMSRPSGVAGARVIERASGPEYQISIDAAGVAVSVTQRDIREFQLAKGALRAGIEILLRRAGFDASDITRVVMAGAFGAGLDGEAVFATGTIPSCPQAELVSAGHAAGEGAILALIDDRIHREAIRLADEVEHVDLASYDGFFDIFAASMGIHEGGEGGCS